MSFRFTKLGFNDALWSLIPIFPITTIIPAALVADFITGKIFNCETSYKLVLFASIALTVLIVLNYFNRLDQKLSKGKNAVKESFRVFNLAIYTLVNTAALILILGVDLACNGDGQTILACLYSGPLASISLVLLGFGADLKIRKAARNRI
ncbi:hypothetical protein [Pontibacter vulgaris]|uniref:hypothetical protein n=1 Tax=Pontibacter vulgaris TaxID=2905679 RepID=UPI001FA6BF2E|nr:hypothetical protein [Pontibacter vulgaris]